MLSFLTKPFYYFYINDINIYFHENILTSSMMKNIYTFRVREKYIHWLLKLLESRKEGTDIFNVWNIPVDLNHPLFI